VAEADDALISNLRLVLGVCAALIVAALLWRRWIRDRARREAAPQRLFGRLLPLLEDATLESSGTVGYPRLRGHYAGAPVQLWPVVDTLALRRLPALWLMVTVQSPLPVAAKLDFMMRPAGTTTFSNFDLLPHTLALPGGFPEGGALRTDDVVRAPPASWLAGHLDIFEQPRAKELLVAPQGLRLVWLLAEADRARYGVFRQAEFGDVEIDPAQVEDLLQRLLRLRDAIIVRAGASQ
jgi:hypothetical protein